MSSNYNRPNQGRVPGYKPTPASDSTGRPLLDDLLDDPAPGLSGGNFNVPPPPPPPPGYNPAVVTHPQATISRPLDSFDLPENLSDLGLTTRTPSQARAQRFQTPEGRQFVARNGAATEPGRKTKPLENEIVDFRYDTEPSRYISNAPETVADALREKRPYTYSDTPENRTRVIGTPLFDLLDEEPEEVEVAAPPPPPVNPAHLINEPTYDATKRRARQRNRRRAGIISFRNPAVALSGGLIAAIIVLLLVALLFFLGRSIDRTTADKFSVLFSPYGEGQGYALLGNGQIWAKSFSDNFLTRGAISNADVRLDSTVIKDAKSASNEAARTMSDIVVWGYFEPSNGKLYTTLTVTPNGPFDPPVGRGRQVAERSLFDPEQLTFVTTPPADNAPGRLPLVDLIYAISSYYNGNYDVALATVTQLLNQAAPENEAGLRFLRGNILLGYGRNPQAIEDYDRIITLNQAALAQNKPIPVSPIWVYNNRGFAYNLLGKYNEAVDSYKKAFGLPEEILRSNQQISKHLDTPGQGNPLVKVYLNYAQATLDQGQGAISPTDLTDWQNGLIEAIKLEPNSSFAYHYLGLTYRYQSNFDQAIASQTKARDLDDNYLEAHNELGLTYMLKYEREPKPEFLTAAADAYRRGEARADNITTLNRQTRQNLAAAGKQTLAAVWDVRIVESETLLNRMRLGIARTFFEQAKISGKDLGNPLDRLLRWVKGQKTPFEEAGPRLKQMVETMPDYPDANFYYGQYLDFSGEGDPQPYYKKAKDLEPKLNLKFQYYDTLATQYAAAGKKNEALAEYNAFIALDKSRAQGYAARAILQLQFGMIQDAIASANEAIRLAPQDAYSHYVAGQAQIQNSQYAVAVNYLDRAITLNPNLTDAYLQRGIALFDLNRRSEALDSFNKAITQDQYLTQAYYFAGIIYQENAANPQKAQEMWEKAVSINPGYAAAWVKLGMLYSQLNQLDKAINAYNQALAANEQDATTHYYLGLLYEIKNNWPEAEKQYRRAVELNPGLVNARYRLAEAIVHNGGKSDDALNAAQDAVKLDPRSPDAQFTLGELRLSRNEFDQAIQAYDAAIKLHPDYAEAYYGKARALYAKQQLDPALDSINQAIKLRPKWGQAIFLQGSILTDKGQLDEATQSFAQAKPLLDPNDPALLAAIGALDERKGDTAGAINSYEASLKGYEPQPDIHFKLASLYFTQRQFEPALAHFTRVRQLNDKWPQIDYWLGRTYGFLNRNDEAQASLENMIKIQPNFVEAHYELGNVYHVKGQLDLAQAQYDEALKLQPAYYPAWLSKGKVYEEQLNVPEAIKAYQKAGQSPDPQIKQVVADSLRRLGVR